MNSVPSLQWLHLSDFHFQEAGAYDREVILTSLLTSLPDLRSRGYCPDVVFVTGDISNTGAIEEYDAATEFFDKLLEVLSLTRKELFVVPGNHDVYRPAGKFLIRTLSTVGESDSYYEAGSEVIHAKGKLSNFFDWHNKYFSGVRSFSSQSSVGYLERFERKGITLNVCGLNTSIFCQDDYDYGKLWIGRRCLNGMPPKTDLTDAFALTLSHHPVEWLHEAERSIVSTMVRERSDFVLRGHLHETDVEHVSGVHASALHLAAGATYQTEDWPNRALFGRLTPNELVIAPIRYEKSPKPLWTIDTSVYHTSQDFTRAYPHERRVGMVVDHRTISTVTSAPSKPSAARVAFERDLFTTGANESLYAEPRLMDRPPEQAVGDEDRPVRVSIDQIASSDRSYLIETPREYGATSLARRLRLEIEEGGYGEVDEHDAVQLPNYRKRLAEQMLPAKGNIKKTLVLDNFDYTRHERLLKEISSLKVYDRIILLVADNGLRQISPLATGSDDIQFERLFLWGLGRTEIRGLATTLFDTADENIVTSVVDKVYTDLLALCIPLTPSNVLMYLRVLKREDDFKPLNRVDILDRYLTELLRRPSDNTTSAFDAKNKLNLVSQFVYKLFAEGQEYFSESEWKKFCQEYKM
ncbi:metallophosphoesterase [Brevundimonas sp.]|uniref:metallophosphoesterase family protein n=1 Tax=Brevundimonas sp. TaxID=1871086 RepID=UPI0035B2BB5E